MLSSINDTSTGQALAHDHLDDLESFFYVLCWITIGYASPNEPELRVTLQAPWNLSETKNSKLEPLTDLNPHWQAIPCVQVEWPYPVNQSASVANFHIWFPD